MNVSDVTRRIVLERDGHACVSCWRGIRGPLGYSLHHRTPRGMGGTSLAASNSPANLLTLCGSGTTGCHHFVESNRILARTWGYLVPRYQNPADVHVLTAGGWVRYDDDGCLTYADPEEWPIADSEVRSATAIRTGTTTGA